MSDFRWAVVGCGNIARKFIEAALGTPGISVYGLTSLYPEDARRMGEKYGIERVYDRLEQALSDPAVDGVYISAPNDAHRELTLAALNGGKPVLCEKPLTPDPQHTHEVLDLSERRGLFLMEGLWTRFLPVYDRLREIAAQGDIGRIRATRSEFFFQAPDHIRGRLTDPHGGGALLDQGVYGLSFATMFLGTAPDRVWSMANTCGSQVDMQSLVLLGYPDDALATIQNCINCSAPMLGVVFGEQGRFEIPEFIRATRATVHIYGQADLSIASPVVRNVPEGGNTYELDCPFRVNGFEYEIEAAAEAISQGWVEHPKADHAASRAIADISARCREMWGGAVKSEE